MKKIVEISGLGIICLMLFATGSAWAFSYGNTQVPVINATVSETDSGTTVTYSRPILYAGSRMVKRPSYYRECKRKLGYWDENLCAQIYMPKLIQEKFGDVLE